MLSEADNVLLTRTGMGTPMGDVFRHFWQPVALSTELPEPDGAPLRLRVLGEDLRAFRSTDGVVGVVSPRCPHRGADLFFGRNENGGITCAYHGWKFATNGRCLAMPTLEPGPAREKAEDNVRLLAYKVHEAGGFVWAYLGPQEHMPELPQLEFLTLPASHVFVSKKLQQCNWAQSCEGGLDTAHFSFLHMAVSDARDVTDRLMAKVSSDTDTVRWMRADGAPRFTILEHEVGLVLGAARRADGDDNYWRISQFLMPNHGLAPNAFPGENYHGQCWVPIDDVSCWIYNYTWNPDRPLTRSRASAFPQWFRHPFRGRRGPHPPAPARQRLSARSPQAEIRNVHRHRWCFRARRGDSGQSGPDRRSDAGAPWPDRHGRDPVSSHDPRSGA